MPQNLVVTPPHSHLLLLPIKLPALRIPPARPRFVKVSWTSLFDSHEACSCSSHWSSVTRCQHCVHSGGFFVVVRPSYFQEPSRRPYSFSLRLSPRFFKPCTRPEPRSLFVRANCLPSSAACTELSPKPSCPLASLSCRHLSQCLVREKLWIL